MVDFRKLLEESRNESAQDREARRIAESEAYEARLQELLAERRGLVGRLVEQAADFDDYAQRFISDMDRKGREVDWWGEGGPLLFLSDAQTGFLQKLAERLLEMERRAKP